VDQHDCEEQQHQNAANVHEDLGQGEETETKEREEPGDRKKECAESEGESHDVACEDDGPGTDSRQCGKTYEERLRHVSTSCRSGGTGDESGATCLVPSASDTMHAVPDANPGALSTPVARPSGDLTIWSLSNIVSLV
jgi:hypothetical protein